MTSQGIWGERENSLCKHELNSIPDRVNRLERADSMALSQSNFETPRDHRFENY